MDIIVCETIRVHPEPRERPTPVSLCSLRYFILKTKSAPPASILYCPLSQIGHREQSFVCIRNAPSLTGHIPQHVHPDHHTAQGLGYQGICRAMGFWYASENRISGTIPATAPFCEGNTSSMRSASLVGMTGTHISGTAPACLFGDLPRANMVMLHYQRLSGTIPDLSNSRNILILRAEVNNFVSAQQLSFLRLPLRFQGADSSSSSLFVR